MSNAAEIAKKTEEAIRGVHKAFGAPGDHGYDTPEGDALFSLYRCLPELNGLTANCPPNQENDQ